jgi:hypothetical protein
MGVSDPIRNPLCETVVSAPLASENEFATLLELSE